MNGLTTAMATASAAEEGAVAGNGSVTSSRKAKGRGGCGGGGDVGGKPLIIMICGTLVYYHCAYRNSSLVSLLSDVFIVLLCSLAILGLLFRQMNIQVPVDPLEWQISQDAANSIFASLANTIGAAESVLRVAATGHDKRLFFKVVASLYLLSALGRLVSAATVAYVGLCLFCLYMLMENSRWDLNLPVQWPNCSHLRKEYLKEVLHKVQLPGGSIHWEQDF